MTGNPDPAPYLFVYGTLKRNFDNPFSRQLQDASAYISEGAFTGCLYLVSWFPAAIYRPGSPLQVHGEIYRMNDPARLLPVLDEYEDVHADPAQSLYVRSIIPVLSSDKRIFNCWAYLYNRSAEGLQQLYGGRFSGSE